MPGRAVDAHLLTGRMALARGRRDEAARHLRSAAGARHRGQLRTRSAGWLAQATWCEAEGRWRGMLAACDRGLDLLDLHLRTLGATELRTLATAQGAELADMVLRHAVRRGDARLFLEWSERWRATVLRDTPVRPSPDSDLVADLAALRNVAARLDSALDSRSAAPALERERRRLEAAVRQRVLHTPAQGAGQAESFRTADLIGQLGDTDLLELTDVDGQLYAVVVSGGRPHLVHVGPTQAAVHALAHTLFALRREGTGRGTHRLDLAEIGRRLEVNLLGESVRLLRGGPLVVVPTGKLHAVPWGLLPSLRERATAVTPSASAWLRARRAPRPEDDQVVLVGGPRLVTGDAEVRHLVTRYPDAVVLADGDATADRVMAAMDGAWLVHMAAHGTFRGDSPLFSAIELDDGPLTVYDLERLKRAPYRVVLSSCSSAVGVAVGADELLGLVSALISLGSAGVVASVVPVNDPATVPLMTALHDHLRAGSDLAECPDPGPARGQRRSRRPGDGLLVHRAGDLSGPTSQTYPVGDQVAVGGLAPQPELPARQTREVEKADVVGLGPERGSVRGFHHDLPRPRRHDLADHEVGHHLEFQRQVRRREDQDARLAGFGAQPAHGFHGGVEGKGGQGPDMPGVTAVGDLAPGGIVPGRFYQRSKRKIADVHIGSSRRAMLTGQPWSLPLLNPEEQPSTPDTPVPHIFFA